MKREVVQRLYGAIENSDLAQVNSILVEYPKVVFERGEQGEIFIMEKAFNVSEQKKRLFESVSNDENESILRDSTRIANILLSKTMIAAIDDNETGAGSDVLDWLSEYNEELCLKPLQNGYTPLRYALAKGNDDAVEILEDIKQSAPEVGALKECSIFRPASPSDWDPDAISSRNTWDIRA